MSEGEGERGCTCKNTHLREAPLEGGGGASLKNLKKEWNMWHKNTNATVLKMWLGIVKTTLENH